MEFIYEPEVIYAVDSDGKRVAELTFHPISGDIVEIDHTFVDDSLRGQGVANRLVNAAVTQIAEQKKKIIPTCSYAAHWFSTHPEYQYLLVKKSC